ncbi:diaminopimelate decarboxylase [Sediminitomix flava]|uniref:diaminopimelate decarboxylase n=1 Tax=Sediminitomix flava TaxID=379075 RepID=UPI000D6D6F4C|nr:diaminopimelate decarboxylase [Sediminitomix flava]
MNAQNGQYEIQGLNVLDIVKTHGSPLYLYDGDKMEQQYNRLKNAFDGINLKVKYACKSLTNLSVLKLFKKLGSDIDTVSIQEVQLALLAGFTPDQIIFTPNCVSFEEIQEAVELGVMINIDNISILEQFGNHYGSSVPCCIRVNPHIMAGGNSKISVGHIGSKFGISVFQMPHVRKVVENHNIKVVGLHMHSGSDILDSQVFLQAANVLFEATEGFDDLEFIDLGSGFKVAYKEGDVTTNIEEVGKVLGDAFKSFCKSYGRELELWFEPGKYLVSESGLLLVETNVIKHGLAAVFVGVDAGQNHLIRPMMYDAYHHIVNISNPKGKERIYDVVGYICETDTFGHNRKLNEVHEGDILAIKNAGAYGFMMSNNYNSRLRAAEVLIYKGEARLIRKRETMDDIVRNQVDFFESETVQQ